MNITIRHASETDIDFIIEAVMSAEACGTEIISYCRIFNISKTELSELLKSIIIEDIEGQELSLSTFKIALCDGERAGAISFWIEGVEGDSSMIKAQILSHFIGSERWNSAAEKIKIVSSTHIDRKKNSLQIESVYVKPVFRGNKIAQKIILHEMGHLQKNSPEICMAQVMTMNQNRPAIKMYESMGFVKSAETSSDNPAITDILPGSGRVMFEGEIKSIVQSENIYHEH